MTELLYQTDAYVKEFDAIVEITSEEGVVLNRTGFYPGGGGQLCDTGLFNDVNTGADVPVTKVSNNRGIPVHRVEPGSLKPGAVVRGTIDWERRYSLMRTHTALHVLCGVIWRDYGAPVTGGDIKQLAARMDFELEHMSADFAAEVEGRVNEEVAADRPVKVSFLSREKAFTMPELIRTKINLLPEHISEVRVVEIEGLDTQADGGTHVARTGEIGRVKVVGHESKGRINKRLRIEIVPANG
jgi:misacylated tRNA(Ala) deacylase